MENNHHDHKQENSNKPIELPNNKINKANKIGFYLISAILGLLSIILPTFFLPDLKRYDSPLFPTVRTGIEGISMWSFLFLFLSGFGLKLMSKLPPWKIGLMTMVLFPVMAIFEIFVDVSSHNMLPIEIIFYAVYSFPAIIGAYVAQTIKTGF